MTAKEYLESMAGMRDRIESICCKIEECRDRVISTTQSYGGITSAHGASDDKIAGNVSRAVDLESELNEIKNDFERFELRVIKQIQSLPNGTYASLLMHKYVNGKTWEEIAEILGRNVDTVKKNMHGYAIAEFERHVPESSRNTPKYPEIPRNTLL